MTPITFSKPSAIRPMLTDKSTHLATQALTFTTQRHCINKDVQQAVMDTLADKSSADHLAAAIFKNAFLFGYLPELNQLILHIETYHGKDTVVINKHVTDLLAADGIELIQNNDNTIQISHTVVACTRQERHQQIALATREFLSDDLAKLICSFDDEIDIGERNQEEILRIFMSNDISAKGLLIAAASRQHKIPYINDVFALFRSMDVSLDLIGVDLSDLDLMGINLNGADMSHANLRRSLLNRAQLAGTWLISANLNQCDLTNANLSSANLSYARLIGAKLLRAVLMGSLLTNTCLVCANLQGAEMGASRTTGEAFYNYANLKNILIQENFALIDSIYMRLENDCTAYIVPTTQPYDSRPEDRHFFDALHTAPASNDIYIEENEQHILSDHGIAMMPIKGSDKLAWRCNREVALHQDGHRHREIDSVLEPRGFPGNLTKLIASYDDDIEISERNKKAIVDIFRSGDLSAKRLLIASASHHRLMPALNNVLKELRTNKITLDLSYVDLSELNLTGIYLVAAKLSHANLQNSCLNKALLHMAQLDYANLNGATFNDAVLDRADLSCARLIGAKLTPTRLNGTKFDYALLLCATIETPEVNQTIWQSHYQFAKVTRSDYPLAFTQPRFHSYNPTSDYQLQGINTPLNAIIIPDTDDPYNPTGISTLPGLDKASFVITESEKYRLSTSGIQIDDNHDGTFRLSRATVIHKKYERMQLIDSTLRTIFPKELTDLISDYDAQIEVSELNETVLLKMLRSKDPVEKAQVIAAASHQSQIDYLNSLIQKLKVRREQLNLSGVDLSNLKLQGIYLSGAILTGASLHGCDLSRAFLHRANLVGANLNGASLESTDLTSADLREARLMGANLTDAKLSKVKLTRAILKFANLTKADLQGGADLQGAYLDYTNLSSALFTDANLIGASLMHAHMIRTRFNGANLTDASFMHAKLTSTDLTMANLTSANFRHAMLNEITLTEDSILTRTIWTDASFHQIDADQATKKQLPLRMWLHCK